MITSRKLIAAAALMSAIGFSYAQTPAPATSMEPAAGAPQKSPDPLVQKREADSMAKKNYKAEKKAAKNEYKADKKMEKTELKDEKAMTKKERDAALKTDPTKPPATN